MSYNISKIEKIIDASVLQAGNDNVIEYLLTDSRKLLFAESSLFFALPGAGRNGTFFIKSLYDKGVKSFVVSKEFKIAEQQEMKEATFLVVNNVLSALQQLATFHRHRFTYPVIGITGSNGKTIVKEWLTQLLGDNFNIVRNPKSYNSQIGVPLSVWRMNEDHTLGIFESGISQTDEMIYLQQMIDPEIGIVSFIGEAHAQGFSSLNQKIKEKLLLFKNLKQLVFCCDDVELSKEINHFISTTNTTLKLFCWGKKNKADLQIKSIERKNQRTEILCEYAGNEFSFLIPFTDEASINNAVTCCAVLLLLKLPISAIILKMEALRPIEMRLELKQGKNNCSIINDGYSSDLQSLGISLDFLDQQNQQGKRTVILSDILQTSDDAATLYLKVAQLIAQKNVNRLFGIGKEISAKANLFSGIGETYFYNSTEDFLISLPQHSFQNEIILLKGARIFRFEKISQQLEQKFHETQLEINLNALRHNLTVYKKMLKPEVKMMAMVKAFSYGSGSFEIANVLQHAGVDYLAVAYADEGVDLRTAGIKLPIMVLNTEPSGFENIIKYKLQPEVYSFNILNEFLHFLKNNHVENYPVHIKIDTGMRRLGFELKEIKDLCQLLKDNKLIRIISVFSHLAASGNEAHDDFTLLQKNTFITAADLIEQTLGYTLMRHIANSSAIYRHPQLQFDMIRLGIGLYGIDASPSVQHRLQNVTTLKTTIAQIKLVKQGESIGYGRAAIASKDSKIATVRIGYADGYPRLLSRGIGKMLVNGNIAPVIGNICMDMTMLDITGIEAFEGDTVIVFGEEPTVESLATWCNTISYEILTNISQRVKRVYYEE